MERKRVAEIIDQLRILIEHIILTLGYPGIVLIMFVENLFPPIPSELVMPFAGFLAAEGRLSYPGILIAGTLGSLLGALAIYWIGRKINERVIRDWLRGNGRYLLLGEDDLNRAIYLFEKHGTKLVIFGRLIPGVRSIISLPAGFQAMNMGVFLISTVIGTILWNILLTTAGFLLGQQWELVLGFVETYETILWIGMIFLIGIFILRRVASMDKGLS